MQNPSANEEKMSRQRRMNKRTKLESGVEKMEKKVCKHFEKMGFLI
jgi:hypothetical protein